MTAREKEIPERSAVGPGIAIGWTLAGIGVGAMLSLILTPKKGREMREWIREKFSGHKPEESGAKVVPFRKRV